ncbi:hypothetical protein MJT46_003316 [Ovis ammon polii x Ovis aries]|nr:hypothetical protein MJT46_003316 [Ovis ammon polii x Ovis aries]
MDVKLVFVMEGEPPHLKADVISKRNQVRYGPSGKTWSQKTGRSHFKSVLKECLEMLECLGIPWVQAAGEAEAMCAYLNASGYVDGCLTNDGDTFLYGAQTVYRNFTMNTKGVPGVGKEQALKLIKILKGQSLLQRFNQWNEKSCYSNSQPVLVNKLAHCSVCSHPGSSKDHERIGCKLCQTDQYCEPHDYEYCCPCEWHRAEHERQLSTIENNIKKKACSCEGFPFHEVTQEFLLNKDKLVKAIRIVKNRIRNGVHCFEIEWEKPEHYATEDKHGELALQTIEEESLFEAAYPEIVAIYQKQKSENKGKKQKSMKIKSNGNSLQESDAMMKVQSHMTLKPTWEIFPKQNSKLSLESSPDSASPEESISTPLNVLLLPEDAVCLTTQEQSISSPRSLAVQQIKDISKSLIAESSQPSTSSHNISAVADLHLSTIDWEGTSFSTSSSNSPAIHRNTFTHGLKSELETAIPDSLKNNPEQLYCESERHTTSVNKLSCWDLQKTNPEEHLLSGISDLHLQDLPLKERILIKSYPQNTVEPDVDLKTFSLLTVKEQCVANSTSHCPPYLSKDLLGIHLQNESRNCKVLKGDQLFQENDKSNTSVPLSVNNPGTKTSNVRTGPPNAALYHSRKAGVQIARKTVMKKSVCLDRLSSDEESVPEFGKAKSTTQTVKQSSQKHSPTQLKKNDANKLSNPKAYIKEIEQCVQAYKPARNEEACLPDAPKEPPSFLRYHKDKDDSGTCLDSPLPLSQRLKLRFQNT